MNLSNVLSTYISKEILEETFSTISVKEQLLSTGIVDSMGMMKIVRFIEKTYKINIPFEDMTIENFMTIETISKYVSKKLDKNQ